MFPLNIDFLSGSARYPLNTFTLMLIDDSPLAPSASNFSLSIFFILDNVGNTCYIVFQLRYVFWMSETADPDSILTFDIRIHKKVGSSCTILNSFPFLNLFCRFRTLVNIFSAQSSSIELWSAFVLITTNFCCSAQASSCTK